MQIYIDPTAREFILARGAPKSITIEFDKNNSAKSGASPEMIHPTVWLGKSTNYNETYERRDEITPIYETRKLPGVIEVYKLLPKTNCKKCGEPSCLALATKLSTYQVDETHCPELFLEANAELKTATKGAVAK